MPFEFFRRLDASDDLALDGLFAHLNPPDEVPVSGNGVDVLAEFRAGWVLGEFFETLGVTPIIGRTITEEDERPGAAPVAVVSHRLWDRYLQGNPNVVGQALPLLLPIRGVTRFAIIGVAPREFEGVTADFRQDIWLPMTQAPTSAADRSEMPPVVQMMGRLGSGRSDDEVQAQADLIYRRVFTDDDQRSVVVQSAARGVSSLRFEYGAALATLGGITALVLLLSWTNAAAMQAVRSARRDREIATHMAMGSGKRAVVGRVFVECVLLNVLAAGLAIPLSLGAVHVALRFLPVEPGFIASIELDGAVPFTLALSAVSAGLLGVFRYSRLHRLDVIGHLQGHAAANGHHARGIAHRWMISGQIAFSLVLLIVGGLFLRTFVNSTAQDDAIGRSDVLEFAVLPKIPQSPSSDRPPYSGLSGPEIYQQLLANPEILSATHYDEKGLFGRPHDTTPLRVPGYTAPRGADLTAAIYRVGPRFFETFGIPLVLGRDFRDEDLLREPSPFARFQSNPRIPTADSAVGVISQSMAERFFGSFNPIGRTIDNGDTRVEIVGVVGDLGHGNLADEARWTVYRLMYTQHWYANAFAVRTGTDVTAHIGRIENLVETVDSDLRALEFVTMSDLVDRTYVREWFMAILGALFGVVALVLLAVGTYGLVASDVVRRRPELGIRTALGAPRLRVVWTIAQSLTVILFVGTAGGLLITRAAADILSAVLFGVEPADVWTVSLASAILLFSGAVAGLYPAWRAANMNPVEVLDLH